MKKHGWVRVVEAFISILLIVGILLTIINKGYLDKSDISSKIYEEENSILKEIELNQTLRNDILSGEQLPIEWENFPQSIKDKIENEISEYVECEARICNVNAICELENYPEKSVYVNSVFISSNLSKYSPRQLRLFCWMR